MKTLRLLWALPALTLLAQAPDPHQRLAKEILAELISMDTTGEHGDTTPAAKAMAKRLLDAGFPAADIQIVGPEARHQNLVARYRGRDLGKPILVLAHLDVVEAKRSDWTLEPFAFTERDGWFYGRGTQDIKNEAAIQVATFIRLKREGFKPRQDLILALTTGEEGSTFYNGIEWLLAHRRDLIEAEYCLNGDGGGPVATKGLPRFRAFQTCEKAFYTFTLEAKDSGGHSSLPRKTNPIHAVSAGIARIADYTFPVDLNETTRAFFARMSKVEGGPPGMDMAALVQNPPDSVPWKAGVERLSEDPYWNAQMRTTAVTTLVSGGHASNALPQTAKANVNCRLLPGEDILAVKARLESLVNNPHVKVTLEGTPQKNLASPLRQDLMTALEKTTLMVWPGCPVLPAMETGGTDGAKLRIAGIPTYGISGVPIDQDDVRAHGQDERIRETNYYEGLRAFELLIRELAR